MITSICGLDCTNCKLKDTCEGCGSISRKCVVAACCQNKGHDKCNQCLDQSCELRKRMMAEFNALGIEDMAEVTNLNLLKGSFINLEYTLPNGQAVKLLDDDKIYLGNQICKKGGPRCYGLAADESHLLVCEYGDGGSDPEIVLYKKRN